MVNLLFSEKREEKTELTWKEIPSEMAHIRFTPQIVEQVLHK